MDSHCIEFHGPAVDAEISYGEASVDGDHTDRIEVVGYIQKGGDTWDTDIDPLEAATSYEEAGGGWTYRESASHGQAVVVLQLTGEDSTDTDSNSNETATTGPDNRTSTNTEDETPGFGILGTLVGMLSLATVALVSYYR